MDRPDPLETLTGTTELRGIYDEPTDRAKRKTLRRLDVHCRRFIALSPFLCLGTSSAAGSDVSPRGDAPGFVQVLDDTTLAIPDRPGNNRLDSLSNVLENPAVGLLFLVPGVDEILRVNGTARVVTDGELLARCEVNGKRPASALVVEVREAFLHCGKAAIRSRLWKDDYKVARGTLPSLGRMVTEQIDGGLSAEELEAKVKVADERIDDAYANRLY
ncbi:MAG TPA: pyridoxamine 5'-phosphate oxidase family protein [Candidatus Cybelea sp.]|nr:pyridoxamine 5'-phosphate oxidase family protein [Candidatus Cybelea sp.]